MGLERGNGKLGIGHWALGIGKQLSSAIAPEFSGAKQVKLALFGARWSDRGCILNFKSDRTNINDIDPKAEFAIPDRPDAIYRK